MRSVLDLLKEARQTRDLAARAQRLAEAKADPADKARIRSWVEELLKQAARLEEEAAAAKRPTIF
jgi:hypothetical protein